LERYPLSGVGKPAQTLVVVFDLSGFDGCNGEDEDPDAA